MLAPYLYQLRTLLAWADHCQWDDERLSLALGVYLERNMARLGLGGAS